MRTPQFLLCSLLFLAPVLSAQVIAQSSAQEPLAPAIHARVNSAPIAELSGLIKSRRYENLYWAHNDSGHGPRIFAINGDGQSVLPTYSKFSFYGDEEQSGKEQWPGFEVLYADSVDWEDIASDDNYLYLADTGNNGNERQDMVIYAISEIDPTASTRSAVVQKLPVRYPEQQEFPPANWHYDSESLFADNGSLYLVTKHRETGKPLTFEAGANLYRLDTRHTDTVNDLIFVENSPLITAATGADLSPDGLHLAIVSYSDLWIFDRPAEGDKWLSSTYQQIPLDRSVVRQVEAVAWVNNDTVLLANENRSMFKLELTLTMNMQDAK